MEDNSPIWGDVVKHLQDEVPPQGHCGTISVFSGRQPEPVYASIGGAKPFLVSEPDCTFSVIPDGWIVIFSTHVDYIHLGVSIPSENGDFVDSTCNRNTGRYRKINVATLYQDGAPAVSIPGLGLRIGKTAGSVGLGNAGSLELGKSKALLDDNVVGLGLIPVIARDGVEEYYVNSLGITHTIRSKHAEDLDLLPGLYTFDGKSDPSRLGPIVDYIHSDESSLRRGVNLFVSRREAEKYSDPSVIYDSLASAAKENAVKRDMELVEIKSETAKVDNAVKVETLKAKGSYETGSLGRKSSSEEVTHTRGMTLGIMALGTAGLGVIAKLGLGMAFMSGINGFSGSGATALAALFSNSSTVGIISGIFSSAFTPIVSAVTSVVSTGLSLIGGVVNAGCSVIGSVFRGGGRLLGLW